DRQTGRRRRKVMHGQTGHLHKVTERRLRYIRLPVCVSHETDRGVKVEVRTDVTSAIALGIERKPGLQPLDRIEQHRAERAEGQQSSRISRPVLLLRLRDPADLVDQTFHRSENRRKEVPAAFDDRRDERSQGLRTDNDQSEENRYLQPTIDGHDILPKFTSELKISPVSAARTANTLPAPAKRTRQSRI